CDSNENLASRLPPMTGGSWKKSPVQTSWMPPQGFSFLRSTRARDSSLSNKPASIMEISSMMSTL
ncbi:hypothetical protein BCR37DRAFT_335673, partial [Protomyces lactucae-debilis]